MMTAERETLRHAAMTLAGLGHPVFPLAPRTKLPAISKERGGNGLYDATDDVSRIDRWWRRHPDCNIGVRTGVSFDVWDIDDPSELSDEGKHYVANAEGPTAVTGKGGLHILVRPTGMGNRAGFIPGCDWRGAGGYIVAPPSIHPNGETYAWLDGCGVREPIPDVPDWLLAQLRPPEPVRAPVSLPAGRPKDGGAAILAGLVRTVLQAQNGARNHALNWASYRLSEHIAAGRVPAEAGVRALLEAAAAAGLGESESKATVESGLRGGGT